MFKRKAEGGDGGEPKRPAVGEPEPALLAASEQHKQKVADLIQQADVAVKAGDVATVQILLQQLDELSTEALAGETWANELLENHYR